MTSVFSRGTKWFSICQNIKQSPIRTYSLHFHSTNCRVFCYSSETTKQSQCIPLDNRIISMQFSISFKAVVYVNINCKTKSFSFLLDNSRNTMGNVLAGSLCSRWLCHWRCSFRELWRSHWHRRWYERERENLKKNCLFCKN